MAIVAHNEICVSVTWRRYLDKLMDVRGHATLLPAPVETKTMDIPVCDNKPQVHVSLPMLPTVISVMVNYRD